MQINQTDLPKTGALPSSSHAVAPGQSMPISCKEAVSRANDQLAMGRLWAAEMLFWLALRVQPDQTLIQAFMGLGRVWEQIGLSRACQALFNMISKIEPNKALNLKSFLEMAFIMRGFGPQVALLLQKKRNSRGDSSFWAMKLAEIYAQLGAGSRIIHYLGQIENAKNSDEDVDYLTGWAELFLRDQPIWDERLFGKNKSALSRTNPELAAWIESHAGLAAGFDLFALPGGCLQAVEPGGDWLGGNYTWAQGMLGLGQEPVISDFNQRMAGSYLINGLNMGAELNHIFNITKKQISYDPGIPIYVLERRPEVAALCLGLYDWETLIKSGRVFWFFGSNAPNELIAFFRKNRGIKKPTHFYPPLESRKEGGQFSPGIPNWDLGAINKHITAQENIENQKHFIEIERHINWYRGNGADYFHKKIADCRRQSLRVMLMTSRFTAYAHHCIRDLAKAFEEMGHKAYIFEEGGPCGEFNAWHTMKALEFRPHLMFTINYPSSRLGDFRPPGISFVTWVQDAWSPFRIEAEPALLMGPDDYVMDDTVGKLIMNGVKLSRAIRSFFVSNTSIYRPLNLNLEDRRRYACDFSLVSHHSKPADEVARDYKQAIRDEYGVSSPQLSITEYGIETIWGKAEDERPIDNAVEMKRLLGNHPGFNELDSKFKKRISDDLYHKIHDVYFRQQVMETLAKAGYHIRIWGAGWDRHPTLGKYAQGVAGNGEELCKIFNASRINLHLTAYGGLHHRMFDCWASGGFILRAEAPFSDRVMHFLRIVGEVARQNKPHTWEDLVSAVGDSQERIYVERLKKNLTQHHLLRPVDDGPGFWQEIEKRAEQYIKARKLKLSFEALVPWRDEISFRSRNDLLQKSAQYLGDSDKRKELAEKGYNLVQQRFTFAHLVRHVLSYLQVGNMSYDSGG